MKALVLFLFALLAMNVSAQRNKRKPQPTPTPAPVTSVGIVPRAVTPTPTPDMNKLPPKLYPLTGKIGAIHREIKTLEVEHEAIPDYMEAMTMKFPVKDAKLIEGLKVGDVIQATLHVSQNSGDWWLSDIRRRKAKRQ